MKVNTTSLARALTQLQQVAGKRTPLPVLNTVRVEARNSVLTMQATNLECYVSLDLPCVGNLAACCVPARVFQAVVGQGDETELSLVKGRLHVNPDSSDDKIPTMDAAEFPPLIDVTEATLDVDCEEMADAIEKAGYAFSTEQGRVQLHGVMFEHVDGTLHVATSNGRQLAVARIECGSPMLVSVPMGVIPQLLAALKSEDASIRMNDNWIKVKHKTGFTMFKPMESKPINFRQVIPHEFDPIGQIDRVAFLSALDHCAAYITELDKRIGVLMTPKKDGLRLSVQSQAGESNPVVAGKFREAKSIKFDLDYMRSAIRHLTSDTFPLAYADDLSPMVINDGNVTAVVMPLRKN